MKDRLRAFIANLALKLAAVALPEIKEAVEKAVADVFARLKGELDEASGDGQDGA